MEESDRKEIKIDDVGHLFLSGQERPNSYPEGEAGREKKDSSGPGTCLVAISAARSDISRPIFTVNLAVELARIGRKPAIVPQISIAPNALTLLGLNGLEASTKGDGIEVLEGPFGIVLMLLKDKPTVPFRHLKSKTLSYLEEASRNSQFLLLELPDNITENDAPLLRISDEVILLVPPSPDTMTGAFRQLISIVEIDRDLPVWIVASDVDAVGDGEKIFREMEDLAAEFLGKKLEYLGHVYKDSSYFLTCIDEPSAMLRGRFSRVRRCMYDIVELLCIMDDITLKTSGPRPIISKRL
ncbi:MAG: MinD/ParA family protein [Candidatus Glassbacteria bacterium]